MINDPRMVVGDLGNFRKKVYEWLFIMMIFVLLPEQMHWFWDLESLQQVEIRVVSAQRNANNILCIDFLLRKR